MADIMASFELPDNAVKIKKARESAGNDMLKAMQIVFPVTTQIEADVVKKYGFTGDGEGVNRFAQVVKALATEDSDLADMNSRLRAFIVPQMDMTPPTLSQETT